MIVANVRDSTSSIAEWGKSNLLRPFRIPMIQPTRDWNAVAFDGICKDRKSWFMIILLRDDDLKPLLILASYSVEKKKDLPLLIGRLSCKTQPLMNKIEAH